MTYMTEAGDARQSQREKKGLRDASDVQARRETLRRDVKDLLFAARSAVV